MEAEPSVDDGNGAAFGSKVPERQVGRDISLVFQNSCHLISN